MASLTWSVLWMAFALVAAAPGDYGYGNYVQKPQVPESDAPSDQCSGKENGAYGNGCSKDYWLCWDGLMTAQECSFDLMFNEENGQCDFPDSVFACSGMRPTTQPPADIPTMVPVDFDCSTLEDGDYPFSHKCDVKYVSCVANAAWERSCPGELSFDPDTHICDRLENIVACGGSLPTAAEPVEVNFECPSPSGSFALVSALCSATYYICEDNTPTIAMCADGMIWDDSSKQCLLPADIPDCSFECTGKADAPYSIGCSQNYWWCWEEKATKLACPEGMVFNSANVQCDFSANVFECTGQNVISTTMASDFASPAPVDFDCSNVEDGNHPFANGGHCQPKFVSCVGGVAWELTCPDGLLFDPDQMLCERADQIVACGGSLAEVTKAYDNSYSYNKPQPTTRHVQRKFHKTTLAAEPITRGYNLKKKTTLRSDDGYGSYETTTIAAEPTTRRHIRKTTPVAKPVARKSYYQTTTPAAEPTTTLANDDGYGSYETTTLADKPSTRRHIRKTTPAAKLVTRNSYYQTTTPAAEPTTTFANDGYGSYETSTIAEPTTRRHIRKTTPVVKLTTRGSYYQTTTPAAEPTTTLADDGYGSEETTLATDRPRHHRRHRKTTLPADVPVTRASYYQTTLADEPITTTRRNSYGQKRIIKTTLAEPTTTQASYGSYDTTTLADEPITTTRRNSYGQKRVKTTLAEPTTTEASYGSYDTTTLADEPITTTRRNSYGQKRVKTTLAEPTTTEASYGSYETTTLADEPITTTRRAYGQRIKTTPAAEPTTRKSYYQTTPAAEPTTRASYYQKKTTTLAAEPTTRKSYYQKTTTLAAEPTTRASYYQKKTTTLAAEPTTRKSYYQTTTPAAEPTTTLADGYGSYETTLADEPITTTRRSAYGQKRIKTTTLAEPTTVRRLSYNHPSIRRLQKTTLAAQPTIRRSYYQPTTTPAAEPVTRPSYNRILTTPAAEPTTRRRSYKLIKADEPTTRMPQFKQSSYY